MTGHTALNCLNLLVSVLSNIGQPQCWIFRSPTCESRILDTNTVWPPDHDRTRDSGRAFRSVCGGKLLSGYQAEQTLRKELLAPWIVN